MHRSSLRIPNSSSELSSFTATLVSLVFPVLIDQAIAHFSRSFAPLFLSEHPCIHTGQTKEMRIPCESLPDRVVPARTHGEQQASAHGIEQQTQIKEQTCAARVQQTQRKHTLEPKSNTF